MKRKYRRQARWRQRMRDECRCTGCGEKKTLRDLMFDKCFNCRRLNADRLRAKYQPKGAWGGPRPRKLSADQVRAIRAVCAGGGVLKKALASHYGVHPQHISNIVRGVVRKDVAA